MRKKINFTLFGFVLGFVVANALFIPELLAQYGRWSGASFTEMEMQPLLPARFGNLVAVTGSGRRMFFQASDGTVYMVTQRTDTEIDKSVYVIKRSE
ncbi:MAG: hypothetical protein V1863_01155 [Candidatus Omnitrophota bacterium]